jgi:hypothetical protein
VGEDMSEYAGQDNGTLKVTIKEAANRLGVTEAAIRKRIQRGSLDKELGRDGRVYVYLDLTRDMSRPESQVHRDPLVEELVEELRDRVAFLERALERRSVEAERYQQIVAGLTQTNNQLATRLRELEAPPAKPAASQEPPGGPPSAGPVLSREEPRPGGEEAQEPSERVSWWRKVFGG